METPVIKYFKVLFNEDTSHTTILPNTPSQVPGGPGLKFRSLKLLCQKLPCEEADPLPVSHFPCLPIPAFELYGKGPPARLCGHS